MNRSKRIFKVIEKNVPGTVLCNNVLVVCPTEYIVRGFLLEATSEKGRVYLWKVVAPLYRPMSHLILTYGNRIPESGEEIILDENTYAKSIANIQSIISGSPIEYLRSISSPEDFLRHIRWVGEGSPIWPRVDRALTLYLAGRVRHSIDLLRSLNDEIEHMDIQRKKYFAPVIDRVLHEVDKSPSGLAALLDEWVDRNVDSLGLRASRPSLSSPA
jgi:hypothetical protein